MNLTLSRAFLPGLLATALASATLLPVKPASADDQLLRNIGIGAAAGVVTGAITHRSPARGIINGAAAVRLSLVLTEPWAIILDSVICPVTLPLVQALPPLRARSLGSTTLGIML